MTKSSTNIKGISFLVLALLIFSLQSIAVKWIGGDYSVMEIVTIRSLVALPITLMMYRMEGKRGLPITKRPKLEYVRGLIFFLSYTTAFMGLAALPLAEIEAIRSSGPMMISVLSVIILHEKVELYRWIALFIGLIGVLFVINPGSATFNIGSLFVLISVFFYALGVMMTRKLQSTDSSATMAYFSSLVYLGSALVLSPLATAIGESPGTHPSIAFLLRDWTMPTLLDGIIMAGLGLVWAGGMYFIARAYSVAQTSAVAPFEYLSLLISVAWGFLLWHEIPTWTTILGAILTLSSGFYILYREHKKSPA